MQNIINPSLFLKLSLFVLVAMVVTAVPEIALAQSGAYETEVFNIGRGRLASGFRQARTIIYITGGIAALGLGVAAFFGRFKWGWFFAVLGGLAVIALVVEGINFVIGDDVSGTFGTQYRQGTSTGLGPPTP